MRAEPVSLDDSRAGEFRQRAGDASDCRRAVAVSRITLTIGAAVVRGVDHGLDVLTNRLEISTAHARHIESPCRFSARPWRIADSVSATLIALRSPPAETRPRCRLSPRSGELGRDHRHQYGFTHTRCEAYLRASRLSLRISAAVASGPAECDRWKPRWT